MCPAALESSVRDLFFSGQGDAAAPRYVRGAGSCLEGCCGSRGLFSHHLWKEGMVPQSYGPKYTGSAGRKGAYLGCTEPQSLCWVKEVVNFTPLIDLPLRER